VAGFRSVKKYAQAWEDGRVFTSHFRKNYTASAQTFLWLDNSMTGGGPPANYYAATPLTATTLDGSAGIYHGDNKSPAAKFLTHWSMVGNSTNNQAQCILLDYLLFYPFIDMDDLATQEMINSTTLPRYTDGEGLKVMPVCVSPSVGGGLFTFEYVNQDGVTKTSPAQGCATSQPALVGNLVCSSRATFMSGDAVGPFCPLAAGDSGVQRINSVTFSVANGGLMALVLVKPLAGMAIREGSVESEMEFLTGGVPPVRIYDGAYLNFISRPDVGLGSTAITGKLNFIWDEGT